MGRPHTITGSVMAGHVLELELQIALLKRLLNAAVRINSRDHVDYIEAIGTILDVADSIHLAANNMGGIVRANGELPALCPDPLAMMQELTSRITTLLEPPHVG